MARPRTLNSMADLLGSGFGRPCPRHGLQLLYWFATEVIDFDDDNEMQTDFDPTTEEFGFHPYHNEWDDNSGSRLLPQRGYLYYEVGNLHASDSLPSYVTNNFTGHLDDSNTDRIIISMRQGLEVDRVYVTQHDDLMTSFDPDHTFRISRGLLRSIRRMTGLDDFLEEAGYVTEI